MFDIYFIELSKLDQECDVNGINRKNEMVVKLFKFITAATRLTKPLVRY